MTYEDAGLIEVDFCGNTEVLDGTTNPDSVVVVVIWTRGEYDGILSRVEVGSATLVVV